MQVRSTNNTNGATFTELITVGSTNIYAMQQVQQGLAAHGNTYFAQQQTAGKGQRGKSWNAEAGKNILMSIVLNTESINLYNRFGVSIAVALAAHNIFSKYAGDETKIKWPNDIYWRDRKAAGILIENIIRGNQWHWAVAGVGMNINQASFDTTLKNAVSLKQITGSEHNVISMAKELSQQVLFYFQRFADGKFHELLQQYNSLLYKKNETIKLKKANAVFECIVKAVNMQGELEVAGALQPAYTHDEAEWVITKTAD
ncbi:MAG TPA: biotin--[acetyl-CoA-carboxylase] ligase [Chitinophagaceae bacterium]|nr:biotin--[acetyl-CoA-carboxylase] ligase [Chitinophagaceae bacterium]